MPHNGGRKRRYPQCPPTRRPTSSPPQGAVPEATKPGRRKIARPSQKIWAQIGRKRQVKLCKLLRGL
jgi:hypothetical protein